MNEWVEKSIEIANSAGYLDNLSKIYPASVLPRRPLGSIDRQEIKSLHERGDFKGLILFLLGLTKRGHPFPIEHPYASIFRQKRWLIQNNPEVFQLLEKIVMSMSVEDILRGCERPIDLNRVMGQAFQNWLRTYFLNQGTPILPEIEFSGYAKGAFLDGKDAKILDYVNRKLGYSLERGRDFIYKIGDRFVIGEARFLSTSGGSQSRDLNETINFIREVKGRVTAVGVLDGIIWFNRSYVNRLSSLKDDEAAFTVLLLDEFLENFR